MEIDQYFQPPLSTSDSDKDLVASSEMRRSESEAKLGGEADASPLFDCSICLDSVQEPVVTLCGHLFCWACIYRWICALNEYDDDNQKYCPVCKAKISHRTLIPIYGRGRTPKTRTYFGLPPERPSNPVYEVDIPRTQMPPHLNHPNQTQMYGNYASSSFLSSRGMGASVQDPVLGMFREMVSARLFGIGMRDSYDYPNSYHLVTRSNSRVRRHIMQAERSLGRIHFFLLCCVILCLLLF